MSASLLYNDFSTHPMSAVMLKPELQSIVEQLCEDGCKRVNRYIREIQAGDYPSQMRRLQRQDCDAILTELKAIMAVYERGSD